MDGQVKSRNDAYTYCKILADNPEFPWARLLNSQTRQAHAERAWASIDRFSQKCRSQVKGKKGFPQFKKHHVRASNELRNLFIENKLQKLNQELATMLSVSSSLK